MKKDNTIAPSVVVERIAHSNILTGEMIGVVMATNAVHSKSGRDISREKPSLAAFHTEEKDAYIGQFLEGFGMIDVCFAKSGCRELTEEEVQKLAGSRVVVGGPLSAFSKPAQ